MTRRRHTLGQIIRKLAEGDKPADWRRRTRRGVLGASRSPSRAARPSLSRLVRRHEGRCEAAEPARSGRTPG